LFLRQGFFGCAIGKGKLAAKTEIEKLKLSEMTSRQAAKEVARMLVSTCRFHFHSLFTPPSFVLSIYKVHDDAKDKDFELELSWVCEESGFKHQLIPKDVFDESVQAAKAALEAEEMEE